MLAHHNQEERDIAMANMNDPKSLCKVLITSYIVGGTGLNLQNVCYNSVVVEYPRNMATLVQAMMRLPRIGQTRHVTWTFLWPVATYTDLQIARLVSKYADQLLADMRFPEGMKSLGLRKLLAHEMIAQYLGLPFNTYIWELARVRRFDALLSARTRQRGERLSTILRFVQEALIGPGVGFDVNGMGELLECLLVEAERSFVGVTLETVDAAQFWAFVEALRDEHPRQRIRKSAALWEDEEEPPAGPRKLWFGPARSLHANLSNAFAAEMRIDGCTFYSVDHFLAHRRAVLAGETRTAARLAEAASAQAAQKLVGALGDKGDTPQWREAAPGVLAQALACKFRDVDLRAALQDTRPSYLLYCSADAFFGIGVPMGRARTADPAAFGANHLGKALMNLREEFAMEDSGMPVDPPTFEELFQIQPDDRELVEASRRQQTQIETQQARIETQQARIETLQGELDACRAQLLQEQVQAQQAQAQAQQEQRLAPITPRSLPTSATTSGAAGRPDTPATDPTPSKQPRPKRTREASEEEEEEEEEPPRDGSRASAPRSSAVEGSKGVRGRGRGKPPPKKK